MSSQYTAISFDDKDRYLRLLQINQLRASDYSFANLWGWATHYGLEWRFDGDLCWIRQTRGEQAQWAPVGAWRTTEDWAQFPEMAAGSRFIRVPEEVATMWQEKLPKVTLIEERGQWDYLYLTEELATLSGNRFHKKKNHLNQFMNKYEYEYKPLTEDVIEAVLDYQHEWCQWRDCEDSAALLAENDAVGRVLSRFGDIPGLCGGIITIDDKLVAYTLAEPINPGTMVIHFEKASNSIRGSYQAINNLFCKEIAAEYTHVNREQDLGEEGLRKAKESYNPVDFVKKYAVAIG